jgi:hypothetical protein
MWVDLEIFIALVLPNEVIDVVLVEICLDLFQSS